MALYCRFLILVCIAASAAYAAAVEPMVIHVATPDTIKPKVVEMLQEELRERVWVRGMRKVPVVEKVPRKALAFVLSTAGPGTALPEGISLPDHPEAYAIYATAEGRGRQIHLVGRSSRGVLFAVGRVLRELRWNVLGAEEEVPGLLPEPFAPIVSAPAYAYRGHQMGYRNTANSYDLWDERTYEQYFRDLAIFGTNGVELIADPIANFTEPSEYEKARDMKDSPLMEHSQWEMNLRLAKLLDAYDLDVWIWEPLAGDVNIPEIAEAEMKWRRQFYSEISRIDHVFVPGGDPGRTHPDTLLPWLEKHAAILHERFPNAGLWVSNQKFTPEENARFFGYLKEHNPKWLAGIAYGPGTELSVQEVRDLLPAQYPIRHYPDITHNVRCQFPVPGLDRIIAQTLDREGINPRPRQMAGLFKVIMPATNGFVSYSDGCHDDLNKAVFSALGWDPNVPVEEIVRQYARVHFGEAFAQNGARGLFALEEVFAKPIAENEAVGATLENWNSLVYSRLSENYGHPFIDSYRAKGINWRHEMYLFRAMFDKYIHARVNSEQQIEQAAYDALRQAPTVGVPKAIERAQKALAQADLLSVEPELRLALEKMGLDLFESIGFQFSIDPPYRARNPERGALLDKLDRPLNDRLWLEQQFVRILAEPDASKQLASVVELVNWENPAPGSLYDDLGNTSKQPHLVRQTVWENDPGFDHGPYEAHYRQMDNVTKQIDPRLRLSWTDSIETPARTPIVLRYDGLDPGKKYKVRATYFGRYGAVMKFVADGTHVISEEQGIPDPIWPLEFSIPHAATADGNLELAWSLVRNRGCQLAEVWLIPE